VRVNAVNELPGFPDVEVVAGGAGTEKELGGPASEVRWSKEVKRMAVLGNISRWCLGVSTWLARETRCENGVSGPRPTA
jgi:hypothetical protein